MRKNKQTKLWILAGIAVFGFAGSAMATPIGNLTVTNCAPGGGVTVSATTITWLPSAGAGLGCIATGATTNVTYSGGTLTSATGAIKNLTLGGGTVDMFMTFTGTPLDFVLNGLGPGSANSCAGVAVGQSCSFTGSPFVLTNLGPSTGISLSAFGTASDGVGASSNWFGAFTTQINDTIPNIFAIISTGGSITNTHSATFTVSSTVPEPATLSMLGLGLLGLGVIGRRKRKV